jgi:murein DD-endopeptidase MepM/ murein hydrolase activator NlpD
MRSSTHEDVVQLDYSRADGMWNRFNIGFLIFIVLLLPLGVQAGPAQEPEIILYPSSPGPGDIAIITLKNAAVAPEGVFNNRMLYWHSSPNSPNLYKAILAVDLLTIPGEYPLVVTAGSKTIQRTVWVSKKKYPVQRLTLPKGMVELSPENEERATREQKRMAAIWPVSSQQIWSGNFTNPRPGEIITQFGVRRIINKIPKSSHTGIDVSARAGDEVKAPNNAVVALVDDQFYSGNSIVLDHGEGIYTMFFHLSRINVVPGQSVKKGDVIGLVGSTGRSTGPHLHWGARIQGARVDPLELIHLNLE